jgi:hypothetical protein
MIYKGVFLKCAEILPTRLCDNVEDLGPVYSSSSKFISSCYDLESAIDRSIVITVQIQLLESE